MKKIIIVVLVFFNCAGIKPTIVEDKEVVILKNIVLKQHHDHGDFLYLAASLKHPDSVIISFVSQTPDWNYSKNKNNPTFLKLDKAMIKLGSPEAVTLIEDDRYYEKLYFKQPIKLLQHIANAKDVQLIISNNSYVIENNQIKSIKDFYNRVLNH